VNRSFSVLFFAFFRFIFCCWKDYGKAVLFQTRKVSLGENVLKVLFPAGSFSPRKKRKRVVGGALEPKKIFFLPLKNSTKFETSRVAG